MSVVLLRNLRTISFRNSGCCIASFCLQVVPSDETISIEKLKRRDPINFYSQLMLYEDELADHGCSEVLFLLVASSGSLKICNWKAFYSIGFFFSDECAFTSHAHMLLSSLSFLLANRWCFGTNLRYKALQGIGVKHIVEAVDEA